LPDGDGERGNVLRYVKGRRKLAGREMSGDKICPGNISREFDGTGTTSDGG